MDNFFLIISILAIHMFAWLTPGPLFVLIIRNSLVYSRKSGIWTAVGIGFGNFIHITYSIAGLIFIVSVSDIVFDGIKFLGVGYLAYLGIKTFLVKTRVQKMDVSQEGHHSISAFSSAKTGFLINILSPKASLFFASIFASVLASSVSFWVVIFLWIAMPLNSFVMAVLLSVFFTQKRIKLGYTKYENILNKILGILLVIFAVIILFFT